ncbi:MAG: hypothetical protein ACYC3I_02730 [Gemmataceae bacterium]
MREHSFNNQIKVYPPIYRRENLGDADLFIILDEKHVPLPALLERIPRDVLLEAVASLEAESKNIPLGQEIAPPPSFPTGTLASPQTRHFLRERGVTVPQ